MNPHKRMGRSDGELVRTAAEWTADYYRGIGQNDDFVQCIMLLPRRIDQVLSSEGSIADQGGQALPSQKLENIGAAQTGTSPSPFYPFALDAMSFDPNEQFQDPFQEMPLDEFWAIMEGGFTSIEGDQPLFT